MDAIFGASIGSGPYLFNSVAPAHCSSLELTTAPVYIKIDAASPSRISGGTVVTIPIM